MNVGDKDNRLLMMAIKNAAVKNVVIVGGGTAGWMAAAALSKLLGKGLAITLIESDEIASVGVGEATIPPIRTFHRLLGINEAEFMAQTQASFKLGIEFAHWSNSAAGNDCYIHSFGQTGKECWAGEFQHFWLHGREQGFDADFGEYCFELQAAKAGKFALSADQPINYAYHLDASLYAKYLRRWCEANAHKSQGVKRIEGKVVKVKTHPESGYIQSVKLQNGEVIEGDLFIDCSGFKGLLIEQALHTGYDDWSHWLPCDSAVAVQTRSTDPLLPYTRAIAHDSGWQWRIPLQHRTGNGLVYCSRYLSDEQATEQLLDNIEGEALSKPKVIKFRTGRRRKGWNKNCIALGLASGFIEPLESTSIHLIMTGIIRLLRLFPFDGITESAVNEYNSKLTSELQSIRDFIVLHYKVTSRQGSDFWQHCQQMEIPAGLAHKISLFKQTGRVFLDDGDIFRVDSWVQVMLGQGIMPQQYHHIAATMSDEELAGFLNGLKAQITQAVAKLPSHQGFIAQYCQAQTNLNPKFGSSLTPDDKRTC